MLDKFQQVVADWINSLPLINHPKLHMLATSVEDSLASKPISVYETYKPVEFAVSVEQNTFVPEEGGSAWLLLPAVLIVFFIGYYG